jgi:hypothetical protein
MLIFLAETTSKKCQNKGKSVGTHPGGFSLLQQSKRRAQKAVFLVGIDLKALF